MDDAVRKIGIACALGPIEPFGEPRRHLAELAVAGARDSFEPHAQIGDAESARPLFGERRGRAVHLGELSSDLARHVGRDARLAEDLAVPPGKEGDGARVPLGVDRDGEAAAVRAGQRPRRRDAVRGEVIEQARLTFGSRLVLLLVDA